MHVLFGSTVFFIGLPCDSTRTIKGLVKVLCLIPSCIAKLVTSTVLKFCNFITLIVKSSERNYDINYIRKKEKKRNTIVYRKKQTPYM